MRNGAECWQGTAAGLDADPSVLRQIIIDKYPAAGQYVRFLLQNNMRRQWADGLRSYTTGNQTARCCQYGKRKKGSRYSKTK